LLCGQPVDCFDSQGLCPRCSPRPARTEFERIIPDLPVQSAPPPVMPEFVAMLMGA